MEKKRRRFENAGRVILAVACAACILLVIGTLAVVNTGARMTIREAKNVNTALNAVEIEWFGKGSTIYNPEKPDGLSGGVAEEVKKFSSETGKVVLTGFDRKEDRVTEFSYTHGLYTVVYSSPTDTERTWTAYFNWPVVSYSTRQEK